MFMRPRYGPRRAIGLALEACELRRGRDELQPRRGCRWLAPAMTVHGRLSVLARRRDPRSRLLGAELCRSRAGLRRRASRPVDRIEVEAARAIHLDTPELEARHRGKLEESDLPHERFEHPFPDEDDPRRPSRRALPEREQAVHGFGILETPRVGLEHPEEHLVVGCEA